MLTPERRRGKLSRYSTLNDFQGQKCYRLLSGTELKTKLSAHAMLEEQIKALSLHSHEGLLEKSVGTGSKGDIWQTFYFRLEPSRLAFYTPTPSQLQLQQEQLQNEQLQQQDPAKLAEKGKKMGEGELGEPAGQFLLEEVLSVNSRGKLYEIEIRDNHDQMHLLRAHTKEELKLWTFTIVKALACIGCQKKLAELSDNKSNILLRKRPTVMKSKSHVGCFATEGRRSTMEDEWFIREKNATPSHSTLAAIFDGHSGINAAQFVRDVLPDSIMKKMGGAGVNGGNGVANGASNNNNSNNNNQSSTTCDDNNDNNNTSNSGEGDFIDIMKESFVSCERSFLDQALTTGDRSGTTALVVMASATEVMVSNCGDSRAVLCRDRKAIDLSRDHKPFHPDEKARIEEHGGWVEEVQVLNIPRLYRLGLDLDTLDESEENSVGWVNVYRVNGVLAMSRSIGDLLIKDLKNQTFDKEFTGELVLAEPEVTITRLEQETDRFVVAATDGLWDVMTSQEVVEYIHDKILAGKNLQSICAKLCTEAVERGSLDNICVIIIDLHHLYYPPPPKSSIIRPTPNRNSRDLNSTTPPLSATPPFSPGLSRPISLSSSPVFSRPLSASLSSSAPSPSPVVGRSDKQPDV